MVVDTLDNLEKYVSLNPLFADVVKFIKENDLSKLEDGKHFIKESNLCPLYTSPSPRDRQKTRMPSSARNKKNNRTYNH